MMTGTEAQHMQPGEDARRRRIIAAGAVLLVVAGLVVLAVRWSSDGDTVVGPSSTGDTRTTTTPSPSGDAVPPATSTAAPPASAEPTVGADPVQPAPAPVPAPAPAVPTDRPTQQPVELTATAEPVAGVTARLALIEAVTGEATVPGEVGGPALRVTVEVTNSTAAAVDLTGAVVNVYHGSEATPATGLIAPGQEPFPASVAPGASASGRYIFRVPVESRERVTVEVDLATQTPVVLFEGAAAAG